MPMNNTELAVGAFDNLGQSLNREEDYQRHQAELNRPLPTPAQLAPYYLGAVQRGEMSLDDAVLHAKLELHGQHPAGNPSLLGQLRGTPERGFGLGLDSGTQPQQDQSQAPAPSFGGSASGGAPSFDQRAFSMPERGGTIGGTPTPQHGGLTQRDLPALTAVGGIVQRQNAELGRNTRAGERDVTKREEGEANRTSREKIAEGATDSRERVSAAQLKFKYDELATKKDLALQKIANAKKALESNKDIKTAELELREALGLQSQLGQDMRKSADPILQALGGNSSLDAEIGNMHAQVVNEWGKVHAMLEALKVKTGLPGAPEVDAATEAAKTGAITDTLPATGVPKVGGAKPKPTQTPAPTKKVTPKAVQAAQNKIQAKQAESLDQAKARIVQASPGKTVQVTRKGRILIDGVVVFDINKQ